MATHLIDATAVGTRFGVSIEPGVTTTVSEGSVKVTAHGQGDQGNFVILKENEELRVPDSGLTESVFTQVDADEKLEWANGWLVFRGGTIGQAVNEFNRRNSVQIEIEQPEIARLALVGYYRFPVDASAPFARYVADRYGLVLSEDRSEKVVRLRLQ